ncbi:MAG: hypothetical protein ABH840_00300 [Nanoarchaeota archaeon]
MFNIKKASGHVEVVLSFVIFIGFVIFLFSVFPVYQNKKSEIGLDSAERGILNFTLVEVNYFDIVLEGSTECFSYPSKDISSKIIVRDFEGKRLEGKSVGDILYIRDEDYSLPGHGKFYGIYYSSEFSEQGCDNIDTGACESLEDQSIDYEVGLVREDYMVAYNKVLDLTGEYKLNYGSVRGNFSIPKGENFEFAIADLKGKIILNATRKKPERTTVLSRNTPVQMVYQNGTYVFGMLNIKIW